MKRILRGLIVAPFLMAVLGAAVLTLTAPKPPPPIAAIQSVSPVMARYAREQPAPHFITARDGGRLSYRLYPGRPGSGVAVAVHGSSGNTVALHGLATALSARGITVYSVDLRGHGLSPGPDGRLGDVAYRGQYEDDLADFAGLARREHPGERLLLLGHSMGGSTILRTASLPAYAGNYDAYLALSPFIEPGGSMDRPNQGGWTSVSVPRIVVLSILNRFCISALDHMTVLAMAVPADDHNQRPGSYSHALLASANLPRDWKPSIAAVRAPTWVLIGARDELFVAKAYPREVGGANPKIAVSVLAGVTHMGIVTDPAAQAQIGTAALALLGGK